jgi:curved DNA-binding protein CbpA
MKNQDDFQVLGVNNTMSPEELKKVYFKLAKRYHPDRHLEPEMADVKQKLEALFARVHDAYHRVSASEQHQQFEEKHAEEYVENYVEKTGKAVAYFNAGIKDFKAGNFWGAAESFAWSVRLDPVKAPYFYYYALSLARIPRRAREAEENLQKAIEIDPLKPEYHLELGKLYLKAGLRPKALDVFNVGLRDNPFSEKLMEAIRAAGGEVLEADNGDTAGFLNKIFKNKQ